MYAALGEKPTRGYSIPDENLVDMNMYMFVCTHFTHATQINIFGKNITIKQQWNLTQATGHVVVAANTGTTTAVPYPSAARIGHPQIPTNPWSPTPERAIEAWPRPKAPGQQHQRGPPAAMPSRHATKWTNRDPTKITQCNWDPGEPWGVFSETVESDPIITAPHCISAAPPKQGQTPPSR